MVGVIAVTVNQPGRSDLIDFTIESGEKQRNAQEMHPITAPISKLSFRARLPCDHHAGRPRTSE
jgi:hypothetical protein